MTTPRWTNRPEGSTWGDFGPDDQLGRLNLLTPQRRLAAVAEIVEGLAFGLSLPLDIPGQPVLNPRRKPPQLRPTDLDGVPFMNQPLRFANPRNTDVICDDQVLITLQYSTQWDSFAHVGSWFDADGDGEPEKVYYNGYRAHEHILGPGDLRLADCGCGEGASYAMALSIANFAATPIQGRGVMIDLHAHFGDERKLVDFDMLMQVMQADKVQVETGDLVMLHTGFARVLLEMGKDCDGKRLHHTGAVLDGRDERLVARVRPSRDLRFWLRFFEQFAPTHPLVDPTGRWLLLSGARPGDPDDTPRVFRHPLDGGAADEVGAGPFGCYAPPVGA